MTSDLAEELSILSISEDLVPSTVQTASQEVILAFDGLLSPPLFLQTNETECGGKLWPAGMVLAEYLLRNKLDEMEGKKMFVRSNVPVSITIELGAGSGLVGLALAVGLRSTSVRSTTIHLTDGHPPLLPLLKHNIDLNTPNLRNSTSVVPNLLPWGQSISPMIPSPPDILLAADCCYLESNVPLLIATMEALVRKDAVCYFCYKRRRRADKDTIRKLSKLFEVEEIKVQTLGLRQLHTGMRGKVFLFKITSLLPSGALAVQGPNPKSHLCILTSDHILEASNDASNLRTGFEINLNGSTGPVIQFQSNRHYFNLNNKIVTRVSTNAQPETKPFPCGKSSYDQKHEYQDWAAFKISKKMIFVNKPPSFDSCRLPDKLSHSPSYNIEETADLNMNSYVIKQGAQTGVICGRVIAAYNRLPTSDDLG
ncbi:MAG: hypothetical protein ASARMPREDX12_008702 [Alectoria sarmentosa]|nr:MAG: hypothetical protein ASARMPREDX12_008702 [Alectoria sarmentosa]